MKEIQNWILWGTKIYHQIHKKQSFIDIWLFFISVVIVLSSTWERKCRRILLSKIKSWTDLEYQHGSKTNLITILLQAVFITYEVDVVIIMSINSKYPKCNNVVFKVLVAFWQQNHCRDLPVHWTIKMMHRADGEQLRNSRIVIRLSCIQLI